MYPASSKVQWHAKARLNAGASFYIVGRDPAGLPHPENGGANLYDPTHGARVLAAAPGLAGLEIIKFRRAGYNARLGCMDFYDKARDKDFLDISGTEMRRRAREGEPLPDGWVRGKSVK